jgi:hypothetical protein
MAQEAIQRIVDLEVKLDHANRTIHMLESRVNGTPS